MMSWAHLLLPDDLLHPMLFHTPALSRGPQHSPGWRCSEGVERDLLCGWICRKSTWACAGGSTRFRLTSFRASPTWTKPEPLLPHGPFMVARRYVLQTLDSNVVPGSQKYCEPIAIATDVK
jgi:hypothetical protein